MKSYSNLDIIHRLRITGEHNMKYLIQCHYVQLNSFKMTSTMDWACLFLLLLGKQPLFKKITKFKVKSTFKMFCEMSIYNLQPDDWIK